MNNLNPRSFGPGGLIFAVVYPLAAPFGNSTRRRPPKARGEGPPYGVANLQSGKAISIENSVFHWRWRAGAFGASGRAFGAVPHSAAPSAPVPRLRRQCLAFGAGDSGRLYPYDVNI